MLSYSNPDMFTLNEPLIHSCRELQKIQSHRK